MRKFITITFILVVALIKLQGQPAAPTVGTITQPTCSVATGSVFLNDLPATGQWTLTRTPNGFTTYTGTGTTTTITDLPENATYTFTVTDDQGETSVSSGNVVINAQPLTPTAPTIGTITQPNCTSLTGSVTLENLPSGTWTINPGAITGSTSSTTISGIAPGTYNYTVTNASGCTSPASADVVINSQPIPSAPIVGTITQPTCAIGTGSVILSGLPSGNWTINPGAITGSTSSTTISAIAQGTHKYTVTNASGCTSAESAEVVINAQPATPDAPTVGSITQPTCSVATGSVILGGLPSGNWTINPGAITGSTSSTTISGLAQGTHKYTVTNASGCTSTESADVIINAKPATPDAPTVGNITQPTCSVATGSVILSGLPSGNWTINPGAITGSTSSTTISGIAPGTHNYTVTNASGCASPASADVVINSQPIQSAPTVGTITQPTCAIGTGSVILSGLPSGNWTINPGAITGSTSSTTISGIAPGTHNYTVTNASGCTSTESADVVINAQPVTPAAPAVGAITQPTCSIGTGSVILSGLPSGNWTINPGAITGSTSSTTISGIAPGTHNYTVTNASGCTSPSTGNVVINSQPATPTAPVVGTITQPTCSTSTGSVPLSGLPSSGTWTLTRTPGGTTYSGTGTSYTVSGLTANTSYTFTVTNADGCISAASNAVAIGSQPATPTAPTVGTITQPTCSVATGSVVLGGLPSTGTWTLTRTPGGTTYSGTGTSYTVSGLTANTSYTFTVTNADGCISAASNNVTIAAQPTAPAAATASTTIQPTCALATGTIEVTAPTGAYEYNIDGGTYQASTTFAGVSAGSHSILVRRTGDNTCISTETTVTVNAQPSAPAAATASTTIQPTCSLATGTIVVIAPTGVYEYNIDGGTYQASVTFAGVSAGSHNILVRSTVDNTCISIPTSVTVNAQPVTPTAPVIGTITQPTCTTATGSVILNGLPATGTWTLTRTPDGVTTTGTGTSTTISGLAAGTYTFTVTFESGCTSVASGNVVINTQPSTPTTPVVGTITQPTCTVATGSVVLNGLPATGTWTLTRTPAGTTTGTGTSTTLSGLATGTYSYTVTNASGCTSTASANIVINAQPPTPTTPTVGTITDPTCTVATGSAVLNGLPATGSWTLTRTPGGTTSSGTGTSTTIPGIPAGTYTFTVTNASGCTSSASASAVINAQPPTPTAPVIGTITQPTLSVPTGSVVLNGLPATGTWTLIRTPGGTITAGTGSSRTISGLAPGIYTFTVTNSFGCTSPASASIGLFILKLYGPDQKILHSNDIIKLDNSDAGSFSISVESNADWTVSENSLWLKAVKESGSSKITVTYLENISAKDKVAAVKVTYTSNPDFVLNIQQKARVSQLNESKFENVKIYPNPADDFLYLNFGEEEFDKIIISIANIQGFIISAKEYDKITPNQVIEISVSGLPVGQYFIRIGDGISYKSFQMIKY